TGRCAIVWHALEGAMRLAFFDDFRLGLVQGDRLHDVSGAIDDAVPAPQRPAVLIERFGELRGAIERAAGRAEGRPMAGLALRAPVPRPNKLLCAAVNYLEHGVLTELPIEFFIKSAEAVLDPGGEIDLPPVEARVFQHEAELGVVIGRTARRVGAAEALDYVFGYVPFIDVSARGLEPRNYFTQKSFDTFAPIGPAIVTADEVADPQRLRIELDVNGEPRQRFGIDDMANGVRELIAFVLLVMMLRLGDVIATGPNHQALSPIQHGDQVRMRIEDWPELRVSVHDDQRRTWVREIDAAMAAEARRGR